MIDSRLLFIVAITLIILNTALTVEAQQLEKMPRIGYLAATFPSAVSARLESFREGLRELGYLEGKNILIEHRYSEANLDRLPALAAELVRMKVDVIVSGGPAATRPAKKATARIPIVMAYDSDPISNGFAASLARPGGNITGLSAHSPEISGKQMELLKEIIPKLARVAVFGNSAEPANSQSVKEIELAARTIGVQLQHFDVLSVKDIEAAFRAANKGSADAILVLTSPVTNFQRKEIAELAIKHRLPGMYWATELVEDGCLMAYAASNNELYRRAATYVDKILKGAKAADLPIEQPTKFEFIVNLKAAKQIGLTIPQSVLYRAERVIK